MEVTIDLKKLNRILLLCLVAFPLAGLAVEIVSNRIRDYDFFGLQPLFSLSEEGNFPNSFSTLVLLLTALALGCIAHVKRREGAPWSGHWKGLAIIFSYLALDEAASIHEQLNQFFGTGGVLYFAWIIPFSILVAVFAVSYLKFLLHLPARYRYLFALAGVIYVVGALGMELPLGYWTDFHGTHNIQYALIDWLEETLEMVGATIFLSAVARYFNEQVKQVRIETVDSRGSAKGIPAVADRR